MRDPHAPAPPVASACPTCRARAEEGSLFCARCGAFLRGDGKTPDGLNMPLVQLLSEIAHLQRDLLRQFRQGHILQARQFERALQAQAQQLEKTLAHTAQQTQSSEQRLQFWQRLTAGLAAFAGLVLVATQLAG